MASTGTVMQVFLRPSARTPVRAVDAARAVAGLGLEGDHAGGGRRQITLLVEDLVPLARAVVQADPA